MLAACKMVKPTLHIFRTSQLGGGGAVSDNVFNFMKRPITQSYPLHRSIFPESVGEKKRRVYTSLLNSTSVTFCLLNFHLYTTIDQKYTHFNTKGHYHSITN